MSPTRRISFAFGALYLITFITSIAGGPLRWPGISYAASLALFPILFFTFAAAAPVAGALFAAVAVVVAVRLPRYLG